MAAPTRSATAGRHESRTEASGDRPPRNRSRNRTRGGRPAVVKSTRGKGDDSGIVRIDFPGYSGSGSLEEISWEELFEKFDREKLALVYQDTTARGHESNFNKIVSCETVTGVVRSRSGAGKSGGRAISENGRKRTGGCLPTM